jgi:hypothetical protein
MTELWVSAVFSPVGGVRGGHIQQILLFKIFFFKQTADLYHFWPGAAFRNFLCQVAALQAN